MKIIILLFLQDRIFMHYCINFLSNNIQGSNRIHNISFTRFNADYRSRQG